MTNRTQAGPGVARPCYEPVARFCLGVAGAARQRPLAQSTPVALAITTQSVPCRARACPSRRCARASLKGVPDRWHLYRVVSEGAQASAGTVILQVTESVGEHGRRSPNFAEASGLLPDPNELAGPRPGGEGCLGRSSSSTRSSRPPVVIGYQVGVA
jgi:hypothetical protein